MKRTTAISLLLLLLASQFGHHVLFSIQEWNIHEEQEQKILGNIPDAFLERFEDSPNLNWEEPGKEFMVEGRMFDVVRSRSEHGKTIHYAIADGKESDLIRIFSKIQHTMTNGRHMPRNGRSMAKLQIPVFTLPELVPAIPDFSFESAYAPVIKDGTINRPRSVRPCPPWA